MTAEVTDELKQRIQDALLEEFQHNGRAFFKGAAFRIVNGLLVVEVTNSIALRNLDGKQQEILACLQEVVEGLTEVQIVQGQPQPLFAQPEPIEMVPPPPQQPSQPVQRRAEDQRRRLPLILPPKFDSTKTFEAMFRHPGNSEAIEAVEQVVRSVPGTTEYKFIAGPPGTGKSFLLQALGNALQAERPELSVLLTTGAQFVADLKASWEAKAIPEFKAKHCGVDVVLVEAAHLLLRVPSPFARTVLFEILENEELKGIQVVMVSESRPCDLVVPEASISSRLNRGLQRLAYPDDAAKIGLIDFWLQRDGILFDPSVVERLACRLEGDIRVLEGAYARLCSKKELHGIELTVDVVDEVAEDLGIKRARQSISLEDVAEFVRQQTRITLADMRSPDRPANISAARKLFCWLANECVTKNQGTIADFISVTRGVVSLNLKHTREAIAEDVGFKRNIEAMVASLKG